MAEKALDMTAIEAEIARLVGELQQQKVDVNTAVETAKGYTAEARAEMAKVLARVQTNDTSDNKQHKGWLPKEVGEQLRTMKRGESVNAKVRAITVLNDTAALTPNDRRPGIVEYDLRPVGLIDLVPTFECTSNTLEWPTEPEQSALSAIHTTLDGAVDELEDFAVLVSVAGLAIGAYIRLYQLDGSFVEREILAVDPATRTVTVDAAWGEDFADGLDVGIHVLGAVDELARKPETMARFALPTLTLKKIPVLLPMSEQVRETVAGFEAWTRTRLARHVRRSIEWGLLYGDGVTQIHGLFGAPGAMTYLWSAGQFLDSYADAILRAAALIVANEQKYCIINALDWLLILLAKATDGHYLHAGERPIIVQDGGQWRVGNVIVVESYAMLRGDFVIWCDGASIRPVRGEGTFALGWIDDQFARNAITARYEEDTEQAVLNTQRFVLGEFDAAPADPNEFK